MTTSKAALAAARADAKYHSQVAAALDATLKRTLDDALRVHLKVQLNDAKVAIFSDHHRGVGNRADDFRKCQRAYHAAMAFYFSEGYTLVELGDVEELWEERPGPVLKHYRYTAELTAKFHHAGRYVRIFGNHDDAWSFEDEVKRHLHPVFDPETADAGKKLRVHEGILIDVHDGGTDLGRLFLVHGHQGTGSSDRWSRITRIPVRLVWRPIQRLFGVSLNTPAKEWVLRERHNIAMYRWSAARRHLLVAGHTHRPVFRSDSLEDQVIKALETAQRDLAASPTDPVLRRTVSELRAKLEWVRAQDGAAGPEGKPATMDLPSYFNTGCCCFTDGDITGLEICDGEIRLVRWPDDADQPKPFVLARASLRQTLGAVSNPPIAEAT